MYISKGNQCMTSALHSCVRMFISKENQCMTPYPIRCISKYVQIQEKQCGIIMCWYFAPEILDISTVHDTSFLYRCTSTNVRINSA